MWLWLKVFGRAPAWNVALGAMAVALIAAAACAELLTSIVRRSLMARGPQGEVRQHARTTSRVVRLILLVLLTVVFIPPVLELFGQPLKAGLRLGTLIDWLLGSGLKVLLIAMFAYVLTRAVDLTATQFERHLAEQDEPGSHEYAKRARTLGDLARNVATAIVVGVAIIYVLNELHFNVLPLLTGAGIAGLAIGFGAQTLVKDVISGFFLILENQVRIGDIAEINGTGGLVEAIRLRTIVLRDQRGAVHVFPCGSINTLANLTKDFSYAVLDVTVHYRNDTDHVMDVLRRTAAAIQQDPAFSASVLEPLEMLGVENLGDSGVTIRIRMKTVPRRQWDIARELRRRIKKAFEDEGIEIPIIQPSPAPRSAQP